LYGVRLQRCGCRTVFYIRQGNDWHPFALLRSKSSTLYTNTCLDACPFLKFIECGGHCFVRGIATAKFPGDELASFRQIKAPAQGPEKFFAVEQDKRSEEH